MNHPAHLDDRFSEPEGWEWGLFERAGRHIRFGIVLPEKPKALIIALPGLSEFGEKYFETARKCLQRGYGFVVIDWMGQGASGRYLPDHPHKRHGADFGEDVADLKHLLEHHIPKDLPLFMLAHSMGGNIGLRFLIENPDIFQAAGFSAPMIGIHAIGDLPTPLALGLSSALNMLLEKTYTSFHGQTSRRQNKNFNNNPLTSDPRRFPLMEHWMTHNPKLRIGDVTFGWVYHAIRTCLYVQNHAKDIQKPCLLALGSEDKIVCNDAIKQTAKAMPHADLLVLDGARHEILMEADTYRQAFLDRFFKLIDACNQKKKKAL